MSKVFRLYPDGKNTIRDWQGGLAFPYDNKNRKAITDPDGATAKHEITSIPSPFARIDLVKTAFKEVNDLKDHDGQTIFHKMVSDTLDVAEIFFNIRKFEGKVEIIKWDVAQDLNALKASENPGHQCLGDVLDKYLQADATSYNFNNLNSIYLLNYVGGPEELNIIGATSPATLFFSNANDLGYVKNINFGQDIPFDNVYQPLYRRDFEFVKYLFALRNSINNFATLFPEIYDYLAMTYTLTSSEKQAQLRGIDGNTINNYSPIGVTGSQSDVVEVIAGVKLYQQKANTAPGQSEFKINSSLMINVTKSPLVLPVEAGNRYASLQYTTDTWGSTNHAPYSNNTDIDSRILPNDGAKYPYITISDLLENKIIRVPHTMNNKNYFNGNITIDKGELSYLLPLKPQFFNYFKVEELMDNMPDGKPMIEMNLIANDSVKVILRIPITGNKKISYIEYDRIYYKDSSSNIDKNSGGMCEMKFTGFIMPPIKFKNKEQAIFNVSCIQGKSSNISFVFYEKKDRKCPPTQEFNRDGNGKHPTKSVNYLLEKTNFDYIQVSDGSNKGIIIPQFKAPNPTSSFEFAIDLGTSNTHIEFKDKEKDQSQEFDIGEESDKQICEMFVPSYNKNGGQLDLTEEIELLDKDFIPSTIGKGGDYAFPTRTILSYSRSVGASEKIIPFVSANLPFTYGKRDGLSYNKYKANIKWEDNDGKYIKAYIRCLLLLIRNKVLLNDGDLSKTEITWFYPISMPRNRKTLLADSWKEIFEEYFGSEAPKPKAMTESVAPIRYLFEKNAATNILINVDIGGGTTDIAYAKDKTVVFVTSFRFASNDLFEDAFAVESNNNGIIDSYKDEFRNLLNENGLNELVAVFNSEDNKRPSNMASFLFGLSSNSTIKRSKIDSSTIDFNYKLKCDENYRIVFIIFYTSIIYHIAQIIKFKKLLMPRTISFSGNGSKVLRVIPIDTKYLVDYTKHIFKKVMEQEEYGQDDLDLIGLDREDNPKKSTCKGGLKGYNGNEPTSIVFKSDCSGIVENDTYKSIDDEYKKRTIKAVENFFKFVLEDMDKEFGFVKNFGVDPQSLGIAKEIAKKDLRTYLDKGITKLETEYGNKKFDKDSKIEETFFFYPIKGALQSISTEIYKLLKNRQA